MDIKTRNMRLQDSLKLFLVVLKLPFHLALLLLFNVVNYVSPSAAFKLMQSRINENYFRKSISNSFKSSQDIGFVFSLDRVKVNMFLGSTISLGVF